MSAVRRLSRDGFLYALGTMTQRGAALLLIPIYTSTLRVSEYGIVETLTVTVQTLLILINFGLSNALLRFYSECQDKDEVDVMVRTSSSLVLGLSVGLFCLLLPFFDDLGGLFLKDRSAGWLIGLTFLWAMGGALKQQLFAYYRARQSAGTYVILSVGIFLMLVTLNIYLVRYLKLGVLGVLLGNLSVVWCVNLALVIKFWRRGKSVSRAWARKLLQFGLPLIFAMGGWLIINSADRYFLAYYRTLSEVAVYGLGYKVGLLAQMAIITPFQLAWGPFLFARFRSDKEDTMQDFSRILTYLLLIFSMVSLAILLFSSELVALLGGGKFAESAEVIPYVLFAYLFNGIYYWAGSFFHLSKKTSLLSTIVFSMAGLNLLLNWLWVPQWGWVGAARSTVLTIAGTGLLTLFISQKFYQVPIEVRRLTKLGIAMAVVIGVHVMAIIPSGITGWVGRAGILLLLPLLLAVMGFFSSSEIKFITTLPKTIERKFRHTLQRSI